MSAPTRIDLRSDTVTRPTAAMRRAMAEAEVGDDVYREDPTVRRLEEEAARRLGKAAALFVPTGTMGNQIAINIWTRPGQEVILDARCHIIDYELGQMAAFSGALARTIPSPDGFLTPEAVLAAIRPSSHLVSRTALIALENTHMAAGGAIAPQQDIEAIGALARERSIKVHLDGARLFNAAVALERSAGELAAPCDSVMVCLSKGLGAPIGSILAGSADFVEEARQVRKRLGGGMRQVGVLAAAGLVAIRQQIDRLAEDHALARRLAERIAGIPGVSVDVRRVQTNIVIFEVEAGAYALAERWMGEGVLSLPLSDRRVRCATHYDVGPSDIDTATDRLRRVI